MAKRKPNRQDEIEALVKIQRRGAAFGAGLAVNPGFASPNEVDRERGVEPDAPEREQAERAVAARALRELWPSNLRMWIFGAQRQYGRQRLEEELIAMKPLPSGQDARHYRLALRRALERSGPAKKPTRKEEHRTIVNPDYRERILLLILRTSQVALGVYGLWDVITDDPKAKDGFMHDQHYSWFYTDPREPDELEQAREIVANGGMVEGDDLVGYVARINGEKRTVGYAHLILIRLHGVQIQIQPGR